MEFANNRPSSTARTTWAGDVVGRGFEHLPVLGADEQLEVWRIWQDGLSAKRDTKSKQRKQRMAAGEQALEELVGANFRLAKAEARNAAHKYGKGQRLSEILDDYLGSAYLGMIRAFEEFKPEGAISLPSKVVYEVREYLRDYGLAGMPANWHRVITSAKRAEEELTKSLRRRPTDAEIKEEVKRYSLVWATEHLSAQQRESDGVAEAAKTKLVRQGTWSAIEQLDEIRASTRTILSLDAPSKESGVSLAELVGDANAEEGLGVVQWFLSTLGESDRDLVMRRFGLTGDESATFEELAESRAVAWTEVRSHLGSLLGRFNAPHAHFIFCDADFDSRVETEVLESATSRLSSRRAQSRAVTLQA